MKRILLVDDEPAFLDALQRTLGATRDAWEIGRARSGDEALEALARAPVDVLVSGALVAGMSGGDLLGEVKKRHPSVLRLMMVAGRDTEQVQRAASDAHDTLALDGSPAQWREGVARAAALQDVLVNPKLQALVGKLDRLPSMPALYFELVEAMKDPNTTVEGLGRIVGRDVGMTAKVLQLVNSPLFGLREKVASPGQAATFLGLDTLKSLVLSVGVFSQYDERSMKECSIQENWEHSMRVATLARTILGAERAPKTALETGFLAGMMHDAGKLVLALNHPARFRGARVIAERGPHDRADVERRVFGASHAAIGGWLLARWGLPAQAVEAVLFHHTPAAWSEAGCGPLLAVHVADVFARTDLENAHAVLDGLDFAHLERCGLTARLPRWIDVCRTAQRAALER